MENNNQQIKPYGYSFNSKPLNYIFGDEINTKDSIDYLEAALKRNEAERKILVAKIRAWEVKNAKVWSKTN